MSSKKASVPANDSVWLSDDEQAVWRQWLEVNVRLQHQLEAELQALHGLSLAEYGILVTLSEAEANAVRMSDLADQLFISRSLLTHKIGQMEAAGLVTRASCPSDRRGSFAVLTPKGMKALEAAAPTHVAGVRARLIDPLGSKGLSQLSNLLAKSSSALNEAGDK